MQRSTIWDQVAVTCSAIERVSQQYRNFVTSHSVQISEAIVIRR
jgi:hypothetical protein